MEVLVSYMEKNSDIANGFTKRSKEDVMKFWKNLEKEINSSAHLSNLCLNGRRYLLYTKKMVQGESFKI